MTDDKPITADALMAMVNRYAEACDRYAEACDDLGTDLFAQDATKHAALRAAAAGAYAQIRAGIEQYGKEQYARGVNDAWPAGRGSGEPIAMLHDDGHWTHPPGRDPLDRFSGKVRMEVYAAPQSREPLTDEQEREAFEAWCIKRWAGDRNALGRNPVDPASLYSGKYKAGNVEFAWRAWMARARNIRSAG